MRRDRVQYVQHWPWSSYVGYVPTKSAWDYEMKRLDRADPWPVGDGAIHGRCCRYISDEGALICLVVIDVPRINGVSQAVEILTHEVMHAWQFTLEHIGEHDPSSEFEAYMVGHLVRGVFEAYEATKETA